MRTQTERLFLHFNALGALCLGLGLALWGCAEDGGYHGDNNSDSETHWLTLCAQDSDCQDGLSCLCGACTRRCDADDACEALGEVATCLSPEQAGDVCGGVGARLCWRECDQDSDCTSPAGSTCEAGICAPPAANNGTNNGANNGTNNGANNGDGGEQALCEGTDGRWDEVACGHYACGLPNGCEAIIPGCDCGAGANYVAARGCVEDPACGAPGDPRLLCEATEGRWDEVSCGDYQCGVPNDCEAIIPGCDCGAGANFDAGRGCVEDPICGERPAPEVLCEATNGRWDEGACGDYVCGVPNVCQAVIPGCDCGEGGNFDPAQGCLVDPSCRPVDDPRSICEETGGFWDANSCGHYDCGAPPGCDAIVPGCNCGVGNNFDPARGCVPGPLCEQIAPQTLCGWSGGTWDEGACGHYACGDPNDCEAIIPGCDCGASENFVEGFGCLPDLACGEGSDEARCEETGGRWDERSCGHYSCGRAPLCEAVIPGCDCGALADFVAGVGCVEQAACAALPGDARTWRVDPESLTFFQLPINSLRYAVSGYVPEARACVSVIWDHSNTGRLSPRMRCDVNGESFPYVHIEAGVDGPCGNWDYGPNAALNGEVQGCVSFAGTDGGEGLNYVNVAFDLRHEAYEGRVVVSNLPTLDPAPVVVGLSLGEGDAPAWVQTLGEGGGQGWFQLFDERGEAVQINDLCGLPVCGESAPACQEGPWEAAALADEPERGYFDTWDGQVRVLREAGCFDRVPAPAGRYEAELCVGSSVAEINRGDVVGELRCVRRAVSLPAARITATLP
jgi:hypothetical protein